jgi:hypothetical protein
MEMDFGEHQIRGRLSVILDIFSVKIIDRDKR